MARNAIDRVFERRLAALVNSRVPQVLIGGLRGLEKESLRVTPAGRVAHSDHPAALGSALSNPNITTDYSEALLELVTPTFKGNAALMHYLEQLHHFVFRNVGEELLWASSMPCEIDGDDDVPIASYGRSHEGRFKQIYRRGLLTRYGGMMQAIAGVHFNYSFPAVFWPVWAEVLQAAHADAAFISDSYFNLVRNFRRHGWLISWLFGASPALCRSFLQGNRDAALRPWQRATVYGPHATSLRMSDIGYRNRNQAAVSVSANSLREYLRDLMQAVHTPHPPFAALGVNVDGEYRQLNANILQIENEYYSSIRPKRVPRTGELTGQALARAGVEYVEVRSLDLDPFEPTAVSTTQLHFVEALLAMLLIRDSQPISASEQERLDHNHLLVARSGREAGLMLQRDGRAVAIEAWSAELLESMQGVCELLDQGSGNSTYRNALEQQTWKRGQPQLLPAARVLQDLQQREQEFEAYSLDISRQHRDRLLALAADPELQQSFQRQAEESLEDQRRRDAEVTGSFEDFLSAKFVKYPTS
jgi:glutamate--cysteine ligase